MKLPFISGEALDSHLPVNMFFSPQKIYGQNALIGRPGLKPFIDPNNYAPVRGLFALDNSAYTLVGNTLYKIYENGTKEILGTVDSSVGNAWIRGNGTQIQVVAGLSAYVYEDGVLSRLLGPEMSFLPGSLCYASGYFLASALGTKTFYESNVNDGSDYNELENAIVTTLPDNIVALHANNGEIWSFCSNSYEVYYNSSGADFSFGKSFQGCSEEGLAGPHAVTNANGSMFWVSDKNTVLSSAQYSPKKISTALIDRLLSEHSLLDAVSMSFQMNGHSFIVFTIPSADKTYVFDAATGFWYNWASSASNTRWRPNCYAKCWGRHLVGDYQNGKIYELDFDTHDDDGDLFAWQRTVPIHTGTSDRAFLSKLILDFETGTGLSTGQGSAPQAMLEMSKDKCTTWGNERWRSMSNQGQYGRRVYWNGLGSSRYPGVRVTITDPIKRVCTGAYIK